MNENNKINNNKLPSKLLTVYGSGLKSHGGIGGYFSLAAAKVKQKYII